MFDRDRYCEELLLNQDKEDRENNQSTLKGHKPNRVSYNALQIFLLALNILLLLWNLSSGGLGLATRYQGENVPGTFSPAHSVVRYKAKIIDTHPEDSVFAGKPRPELDQAWRDLLYPSMIGMTEDEMKAMNKTSIPLKGGTSFAGYLEVYHMLHCVKTIYEYEYKEHYPDVVRSGKLTTGHWEHCLHVLREGIMCNADIGISTYKWTSADPDDVVGQSMWPRKCVDWSILELWASERALGRHWPEKLEHTLSE